MLCVGVCSPQPYSINGAFSALLRITVVALTFLTQLFAQNRVLFPSPSLVFPNTMDTQRHHGDVAIFVENLSMVAQRSNVQVDSSHDTTVAAWHKMEKWAADAPERGDGWHDWAWQQNNQWSHSGFRVNRSWRDSWHDDRGPRDGDGQRMDRRPVSKAVQVGSGALDSTGDPWANSAENAFCRALTPWRRFLVRCFERAMTCARLLIAH